MVAKGLRHTALIALGTLCIFTAGYAQTEPAPTNAPAGGTAQGGEQVLPPVVVRPEERNAARGGAGGGPAATPGTELGGRSAAYPGLGEQLFGKGELTGLDSITRGESSLFDIPAAGSIIDRQTIREKLPSDMAQTMQNEVGVMVQQTARGQASPFIRGLTGQQVLILVDGIRMNNAIFRAGPNQYFNLIDPGQVERIEVIRGPDSVLWGSDAIGGVINVVTRSASRSRGDYLGGGFTEYFSTADTGSYSRANAEGWIGSSGAFGGGSYLNVNDLHRGGDLGVQPFTNYDQYAGDVKYNYLLDSDTMLTFAVQHFEQENVPRSDRFAPFVFGPPANSPRPTWFDPQQRDLGYVRLQGRVSSGLFDSYTTTFSYSRNKEGSRDVRSATRIDLGEFDDDTVGWTVAFARDLDYLGRLTYGVDLYHDEIDAYRNRYNPVNNTTTPDNPQFPDDSRYERFGTYLTWNVDITERLAATTGVRYENDDAEGTVNAVRGTPMPFSLNYNGWVSTAGLVYKVNPMLHLVGDVSEGFRAPNLDDLTADNPVLQDAQDLPSLGVRPERARTFEIGVKIDTPNFRFQAFEFWTDLQDCIVRQAVDAAGNPVPDVVGPYGTMIPGSSNFIRANSHAYINGTELAGEYLLENGWSTYGNFWYTFGQDLDRDEPFSRIPPTQGILGLRWRENHSRRWFETYAWMVARQERYSAQNNIDSRFPLGGNPGFATLNVRMGRTLDARNRHRVSLALANITNKAYRVLGSGVDGPGFNAIFGYEWSR
jgi:outer membrane receptor protein involved in Fe transport